MGDNPTNEIGNIIENLNPNDLKKEKQNNGAN